MRVGWQWGTGVPICWDTSGAVSLTIPLCILYSTVKDTAYTLVVSAVIFCDFLLVSSSFEDGVGVGWCRVCLWV